MSAAGLAPLTTAGIFVASTAAAGGAAWIKYQYDCDCDCDCEY